MSVGVGEGSGVGVLAGVGLTATPVGATVGEELGSDDGVGVGSGEETCTGTVVGVGSAAGDTPGTSVGVGSWVGVGAGAGSTLVTAGFDSTVSVAGAVAPGPPDEQPIAISRPRARASPMKTEVRGG
ncbi:MAG: hypothetical protein IH960_02155 [Chloroflexi bacterium]|nr:hypothetical protein [Chloroflexota bacterium]